MIPQEEIARLVERLRERAFEISRTGTLGLRPYLLEAADALESLSPPAPAEGFVLVPREPTEAMIYAGAKASNREYGDDCLESIDRPVAGNVYRAMLAASPQSSDAAGER